MKGFAEARQAPYAATRIEQVANLLGGEELLGHRVMNSVDAHEILLEGLPGPALTYLVENLAVIGRTASLEKAVGMSLRTFQRHKEKPTQVLSLEQSGRAWKFAEILIEATSIFGSQAEAEEWLERPATGLDRHRPIDLLATPAGLQLVEDFLERLEYGVYA